MLSPERVCCINWVKILSFCLASARQKMTSDYHRLGSKVGWVTSALGGTPGTGLDIFGIKRYSRGGRAGRLWQHQNMSMGPLNANCWAILPLTARLWL